MNELSVTIYPSDLPSNEKEQMLREVLGCLLRPKKRGKDADRQTQKLEEFASSGNKSSVFHPIND